MNVFRRCLILSLLFFTLAMGPLACTKGVPVFQTINQDAIPQPLFSGATTLNLLGVTSTQTYAVTGQCDPRITSLVITPVGAASGAGTGAALTTAGLTVNCASTGQFSFTLKSLVAMGFTVQNNTNYQIQVQGVTAGGISNASTINIDYTTTGALGPKLVQVTSGSTLSPTVAGQPRQSIGTNFRGEIRVSHTLNSYTNPAVQDVMTVKAGTNFQMKSGVAAESD
jgi:hypothetical protein